MNSPHCSKIDFRIDEFKMGLILNVNNNGTKIVKW